jgi:hypothetical protein
MHDPESETEAHKTVRSLVPAGPDDSLPLLVYGTLLDETFLANLLEHEVPTEPARLEGWEVIELRGLPFPVIRPAGPESARSTVEGRLLHVRGADDYWRLDAYEGVGEGLYERAAVEVVAGTRAEGGGERTIAANVYLPTEATLRRWG